MLKLYENIKKYRKALGLTQTELAELVGYTDGSMITKIESGKVDISRSKVYEFAEALQTTPAILMGLDKEIEKEQEKKIKRYQNRSFRSRTCRCANRSSRRNNRL